MITKKTLIYKNLNAQAANINTLPEDAPIIEQKKELNNVCIPPITDDTNKLINKNPIEIKTIKKKFTFNKFSETLNKDENSNSQAKSQINLQEISQEQPQEKSQINSQEKPLINSQANPKETQNQTKITLNENNFTIKKTTIFKLNKKYENDVDKINKIENVANSEDVEDLENNEDANDYKDYKEYNDNNIIQYLKKIDISKFKQDKLEDTLEILETYNYELNKSIKINKKLKNEAKIDQLELTNKKLNNVLGEIKKTINNLQITKNQAMKNKIIEDFKKKYKKMSNNDFMKKIDLTAPKADRKPEAGVVLWINSKETIYKDPSYKKYTTIQEKNFKNNLKKKKIPMNDEIKEKLDNKRNSIALHTYNPDFFKCRKYDPFNTNTAFDFF